MEVGGPGRDPLRIKGLPKKVTHGLWWLPGVQWECFSGVRNSAELAVDLGTGTPRTASLFLRPLFHGHTDPKHSPEPQEEAPQEVGAAPPPAPG